MARPRKPNNLKVLNGSRRIDETPGLDLPKVDTLPAAPDWLPNPQAVEEFDRLAEILSTNGLLTKGNVSALAVMAALFGSITQIYRGGSVPTGALISQYRASCSDFGLQPAHSHKVTPADTKKSNAFLNHKKGKPI